MKVNGIRCDLCKKMIYKSEAYYCVKVRTGEHIFSLHKYDICQNCWDSITESLERPSINIAKQIGD